MKHPERLTLAVFLLTIVLLGYQLGSYGLLEDNEARFFEISWEMAQSGDWITPRLNYIDHFHKPPGTFWAVAASLRLFGASEWAGRFPVALAALLTLALTARWMFEDGGSSQARRAVLVLITCIEFWFLSRLVLTDMFLTATVTSAFYWAWQARRKSHDLAWLFFWLSLAASFLVKGPIGIVIVLPVLGLFHSSTKSRASWNLRPGLGLTVFLALALPWYLIVCAQNDGLLSYFLQYQTADRMLTTVHGRPGRWWFYLPVLLLGFFPWSATLGSTLRSAWRRGEEIDRLLLLWIAVPVLFFSCAGSKLPTYLLPVFPALAMLTARGAFNSSSQGRYGTTGLASLGLFGLAVTAYLGIGVAPELQPAESYLIAIVTVIATSIVAAALFRSRISEEAWFAWPGITFALVLMLLASALGPCDAAFSSRQLASRIAAQQSGSGDLVEIADHLHGLPFYLNRRLIQVAYPRETQFESEQEFRRYLYPDLPSYLASRQASPSTLYVLRRSDYETYADPRWPHWAVGPWILVQPVPTPTPSMPSGEAQQNSWTFGGGSGLQRS